MLLHGKGGVTVLKFLFQTTLVLLMLCGSVAFVRGQQRDPDRERELNERELELRMWNLRLLSLSARKNANRRSRSEQTMAVAQLQDDFTRLQLLNKELVFAISAKAPLDLKFVSRSVSEIRKRAERLNENLALPEPEEKPALVMTDSVRIEQLKLSILKLGRLIYDFTNNPFFKEASVVDTEQTTKARGELEAIIQLSGQIKKDSDKLERTERHN